MAEQQNREEYFMAVALLSAQCSKDPETKVGACIVNNEGKIVGIGFNCMPAEIDDDRFPWVDSNDNMDKKSLYVCHAELNAVLNKNSSDVKGCTIYVTLHPCNECAKVIIQSGIKRVVYLDEKDNKKTAAAKRIFDTAKKYFDFEYSPYNSRGENIELISQINFESLMKEQKYKRKRKNEISETCSQEYKRKRGNETDEK